MSKAAAGKIVAGLVAVLTVLSIPIVITVGGGLAMVGVVAAGGAAVVNTVDGADGSAGSGDVTGVPEEYRAYILKAGSICPEVTPALIAAQLKNESHFNPNALSPVGAQGIAQFMPGTWASAGKDGDGDGKADPLNPADAIWSQGNYLCSQVEQVKKYKKEGRLKGDIIDLALAAYNAGLGKVLQFGGIPPFPETQAYIPAIKGDMASFAGSGGGMSGAGSFAPISSLGSGDIAHPIPGPLLVTSPYNMRIHPITGKVKKHNGVDLASPNGAPQYAGINGTVIYASPAGTCGNMVQVSGRVGGNDIVLQYCHLSAFSVSKGQPVKKGQQIGLTGVTGGVTGPHVHFEVHINGQTVDPMTLPGFR